MFIFHNKKPTDLQNSKKKRICLSWYLSVIPVLKRLRLESLELLASLGNRVRPSSKNRAVEGKHNALNLANIFLCVFCSYL